MLVIGLLAGAFWGLMVALSDGRVTYCYVVYRSPEGMPPVYQLMGHRDWRHDVLMVTEQRHEQVLYAAQNLSCKLSSDVGSPTPSPKPTPPSPAVPDAIHR